MLLCREAIIFVRSMQFIRVLLFPFSLLYAGVVFLRNQLYDWRWLSSKSGALPTLVIGNLSTGGTGKTPHTEFFLSILQQSGIRVAVLSRGYGRGTKGYRLANSMDNAHTLGDEPFQIHTKFPQIPLAVCENRLLGLEHLKRDSDAQLVVLDDAFQHRALKGDYSVLLTTFDRPYWSDYPLPTGNLRDNKRQAHRANCIIVTKCPQDLSEETRDCYIRSIAPTASQSVFFSTLEYGEPVQLSGTGMDLSQLKMVVGFAGIAHPERFKAYLNDRFDLKKFKSFADHYIFSQSDIERLAAECGTFGHPEIAMVTTEKDAMRLKALVDLPKVPIFYVPIRVKILEHEEELTQRILDELLNKLERN